jgi:HD-like signal output (HDOD) protein
MLWRKLKEQAAIATGDFAKLFGKVELPPLPQVAVRLKQMASDETTGLAEVAEIIAADQAISTRILRFANSAHLGLPHRIGDIRQAATALGLQRLQSLVLGCSIQRVLPTPRDPLDPEEFWRDSLERAVFAEALAGRIARGTEGEAFTGALLQNMAVPVLLGRWSQYYVPIVKKALAESDGGAEGGGRCATGAGGASLVEIEQRELTWTHPQAGAWMARNWGLPDVLTCCIGLHHATPAELDGLGLAASPVAAVAVSSHLPDAAAICEEWLGVAEAQYAELSEQAADSCREVAAMLGIGSPAVA